MLHATEILGAPVDDAGGNYVGRVREMCIDPSEQANRVSRVVIGRGKYQTLMARHDQVTDVTPSSLRLNVPEQALESYVPNEAWLTVQKDLLDQQIIDINGRKVVRVNELSLDEKRVNHHPELLLSAVDIGLSGAVRRLLSGFFPRASRIWSPNCCATGLPSGI
jgi:sporulation protein YlmC with PRC-barrel domain